LKVSPVLEDSNVPTFLLVRHGENDLVKQGRLGGRLPGVHLNDTGRTQAQATARVIAQAKTQAAAPAAAHKPAKNQAQKQAKNQAEAPVWKLYSSPMERAVETAELIAQALGLEIVIRPGLLETNCGDWAGKTVKSLRRLKVWREIQNNPSRFRFPGGETFVECQQRIVGEIEFLRTQHAPKDTVICVSHADPLKLLVAHYLGLPFDNFQRLSIDPASITILHLEESGSRLLALNVAPSFYFARP
jgi:broad specificity phosphatase PhoE